MKYKAKLLSELKSLRPVNFIGLTIAGLINSLGVTLFLAASGLFDSGLSGTSILLNRMFPQISLSIFLVILNLPFFLFGLKKQGAAFTIYSIYAIAMYSLFAFIIQSLILPILPGYDIISGGSPIAGNDLLLCAIFGGLLSGVGSGMTIRYGGAIDGIEVMAVIFAKFIGITVGTFVMIYNTLLYIVAAVLVKSWTIPLYSIIAYMIGLKAVDFVIEGFDKAKAAMIVTSCPDEIAGELSEQLGRGVTLIDAKGYYSKEGKTMIYCVVNRFQISKLKRIISSHDSKAFVTITDISDTLGSSLKFKLPQRKNKKGTPQASSPTKFTLHDHNLHIKKHYKNDKDLIPHDHSEPSDNKSVGKQ